MNNGPQLEQAKWKNQLRGAFAFYNAPFASHPTDEKFALSALSLALREGSSREDIEQEIRTYLNSKAIQKSYIEQQVKWFRIYFRSMYSEMTNCWILHCPQNTERNFLAIFSGRTNLHKVLYHAMQIYESKEFNQVTQFMRAKKKSWLVFSISYYTFPSGAQWQGRVFIGKSPNYVLERADAFLSKGLNPDSIVCWKPKAIPDDPGPSWEGMPYRERG